MDSQREGNLIALLQLLWIKTEKLPVEKNVGRVVCNKTIISYNVLTEPNQDCNQATDTKERIPRDAVNIKTNIFSKSIHISVNPRATQIKITCRSQSSHQMSL